ncbi:MAG: HD-GYP domain-containing protein, partial [Wenzhouxiangellaceae bacterium]
MLPRRLQAQFRVAWLGLLEVHEGHVCLRASHPEVDRMGLKTLASGFAQAGTVFSEARRLGRAYFARLDKPSKSAAVWSDPLLRLLERVGMVSAVLLPVRDKAGTDAVFVLASRDPGAFDGWRGRWLSNVGSLIAAALYKSIHVERLGISMIRGLAELAEKRDITTGRHLERMQRYAGLIAAELVERGRVDTVRDPDYATTIETLAPLHDIGKVGISDLILLKPGRLTDEQTREMRRHPHIGADVLMALGEYLGKPGERVLAHATDIALYHHEKFDGSGYPYGLAGEAIPLSARIVAVADVFDALTSKRPYKRAWTEAEALELLERERGRHFDPEVLDA